MRSIFKDPAVLYKNGGYFCGQVASDKVNNMPRKGFVVLMKTNAYMDITSQDRRLAWLVLQRLE
jgi:hypothetical protein